MDIGSDVKVYKKKDKLDKEHISSWQGKIYIIKEISKIWSKILLFGRIYTEWKSSPIVEA